MRILFLTQWFDPEPGAIRGLPLARWLRERGHEVKVLTGFPNYPTGKVYPGYRLRWRQWEEREGVPILRVALYPNHDSSALRRVANYVSFALSAATIGTSLVGGADVLYVYHPPATVGLPALVLKYARGLPMVYHIADMWPESVVESGMVGRGWMKKVVGGFLGGWCSLVYRHANAITVLSPGFKRLLVERGVPAHKVHVIYNWTEDDVFRPVPRDPGLEEALGFKGRFNVVYAGNLGAFQGLEHVIRAAVRLKHVPAIQVVLAGAGQKELELKALAQELGADNVKFLGHRPFREMPQLNALADVLLVHLKDLPFFAATIPSKTQVSLSSGRPVLMAVRGDAAEVVERAGAGLSCPPEDDAAMADAILRLYQLPGAERAALGERGRAFYLREMSLDVGGKAMETLFRQVIPSLGVRPSVATG